MLFLTLLQQLCDFLRLAAFPLTAATLVETADTPPSHVLLLIGLNPVDHSALQVLGPFSLDQLLVLLLLLPNLLIQLMVDLLEALPDSFNHLLVLLPIPHVEGVPYFQLLDLLILVAFLDLLVELC